MKTTLKYLFFGMTFCFCHLILLAQNRTIDSLLTLIKTDKADTNKVNHLCQLIREYQLTGDYEKGLNMGTEALELADKLDFKKGIAQANGALGSNYSSQANYPKALDCLLKALKLDEELKNKKGIGYCLKQIATVNMNLGDYSKALDGYFKALKIVEELGDKNLIAANLGSIGTLYCVQGDFPKALDYDLKGLKLDEELGNKYRIGIDFGNIGVIYNNQYDYPQALIHYLKALKIAEELGNKDVIANWLANIGNVYTVQKDFSNALDYNFKALKMAEELGSKKIIARSLSYIGIVYYNQANYPQALNYFFKYLKMAEELGDKDYQANALCIIGKFYIETGKFKEAEQYLKRATVLDDSLGVLDDLRQSEEALSQLYDTTGRYKLALIHYKKAIALKDTIFSQENKKQLVRKEMNYEFDKREIASKAEQDKKDAITAEEKQRQKIIIYSVSVGLFLVLLLALFIFRGYRQKQKVNNIITQQKAEVEKQKELVEKKNREITDSINYAKRIQQAKLPKKEEIYSALPQSFVLFKPKDIVSGDFYFFSKNNKQIFIAAADCTGHGVPGAFMSMIGSEKLEDAVSQTNDTSEILKLLNKGIKTALHQSETNESTRDGMDIALCSVDLENSTVKYAGANRPIWLIRKGQTEVEETKATKKAIGGFTEDKQHFDTHELKLKQGDTFYIFTDGYADQFGGEEGKKLMTKKFKEIMLDIQDKTMQEQEKYLETFADNWRRNREQIDDILIIGVRL